MPETKHTPGPWHLSRHDGYVRKAIYSIGDGRKDFNVCEIIHGHIDAEESAANANLIAAAPDLLAALRLCVKDFWGGYSEKHRKSFRANYPDHHIVRVEAAIAKAEGGRNA